MLACAGAEGLLAGRRTRWTVGAKEAQATLVYPEMIGTEASTGHTQLSQKKTQVK